LCVMALKVWDYLPSNDMVNVDDYENVNKFNADIELVKSYRENLRV